MIDHRPLRIRKSGVRPTRDGRQPLPGGNGRPATGHRSPYVLVTGGAGFVGANLCAALAARGERVLLYDNLSRAGVEQNLEWLLHNGNGRVQAEIADVRDAAALGRAVSGASAVIHLAAQVAVTTSLTDPVTDFETNVVGTLNLLEALRRVPHPPPLICTSTNKVYGGLGQVALSPRGTRYVPDDRDLQTCGIAESAPLDFHTPYGCSKGAADQYVLDYARSYNLPAVVFRMSCIYGPRQWGTEDQGWVAHFVRQAVREEPITFYGDGRQVRDLLYVDDLIRAMQLAIRQIDRVRGQAFNVGGGPRNAVSLVDVCELIGRLRGADPEIHYEAWRPGDQRWYVSDTRSLQKAVGWTPVIPVQTGLLRLLQWMNDAGLACIGSGAARERS